MRDKRTDVGYSAPDGMRWANGGGSLIGGCNGWHLAPLDQSGTICGLYGPATRGVLPQPGDRICGNCARIAKIPREIPRPLQHNPEPLKVVKVPRCVHCRRFAPGCVCGSPAYRWDDGC